MYRTKDVFTAGLLLVTAIIAIRADSVNKKPSPTVADQSFARYMIGSSLGVNPETSALCFGYFIPILNNITEELSRTYQQCAENEIVEMNLIEEKMRSSREQLESAAKGVCDRLNSCSSDPIDYFDCFGRRGRESSKVFYTIKKNSTAIGAELREDHNLYEFTKYKCQNASESAYVENTATTYHQLDICLRTGEMPSTVNPTTTTTVATTTITATSSSEENINVDLDQKTTTTTPIQGTEPEVTTPMHPPEAEDSEFMDRGRGLKVLSKLQKFWSN